MDPIVFLPPLYLEPSAWLEHVPFAFWIVARQRPDVVVELGCEDGVSYFALCQAVSWLDSPTRCVGVYTTTDDHPDQAVAAMQERNSGIYSAFSTLVQAGSHELLAARFGDGEIDLLNLRGQEACEVVLGDVALWLGKLSDRGVIVLQGAHSDADPATLELAAQLRKHHPSFEFLHGGGLTIVGVGPDQSTGIAELFEAAHDESRNRAVQAAFARLGKACAADSAEQQLRAAVAEAGRAGRELAEQERRAGLLSRDLQAAAEAMRARRAELKEATLAAERARKAAAAKSGELRRLRQTFSWRLTMPLRVASRLGRRGVQAVRRTAVEKPGRSRDALRGPAASLLWDEAAERDFSLRIGAAYDAHPCEIDRYLVSVILATDDQAKAALSATIESVLAQSHDNFELLIADARGGTAESAAAGHRDARIRYLPLGSQGVAAARNAGLREARGEYVCYVRPGHNWDPGHLRNLVTFLATTGSAAAFSALSADRGDGRSSFRGAEFDYRACLEHNQLDLTTFGHRRLDWATFRFDPALGALAECDYVLRVTRATGAIYLPYLGVVERTAPEAATGQDHLPDGRLDALVTTIRERYADGAGRAGDVVSWSSALGADRLVSDPASLPLERADAERGWLQLIARPRRHERVSVVVRATSDYAQTLACVRSVFEHPDSCDLEVVVVHGDDNTAVGERLHQDLAGHGDVKIVHAGPEASTSSANNLGFAHAEGEHIVFLSDAMTVTRGWLAALLDPLGYDSTVGVTGPKVVLPNGRVSGSGLAFCSLSAVPYPVYEGHPADAPEVNRARVFQALSGGCLAVRAGDFAGIRGFDPVYVAGSEDIDLSLRLYRYRQLRALYVPASVVVRCGAPALGTETGEARDRAVFRSRWGAQVRADDAEIYAEHGFDVVGYSQTDGEPDGPGARYRAELAPGTKEGAVRPAVLNIGFCSIWHTRGVTILTKQLTDAIESPEVRTHIFARGESERFENAGSVWHPSVYDAGDNASPEEILDWVHRLDIHCVVFVEVHATDWKRVAALKAAGVKVVCYEHLDILRVQNLEKYAVFDDFLFSSFTARDYLLKRFPDKRAVLVQWADVPAEPAASDELEFDEELRFVHVGGWGGVNNRKNTDMVIRAFDTAAAPKATLRIYTQVPISKYGDEVVDLCARNPRITLTEGTIPDISVAYRNQDVLLWPSKREGVGLPIIEALANGLTVVISDGYLMKQWIVPGVHGLVCPARPRYGVRALPEMEVDEAGLARQIRELAEDRDLVRELRENVRKDHWIWVWDWQKRVLAEELVAMAAGEHYRPSDALEYIPADVLHFEAHRLAVSSWSD
jgi:glycosyltransferase involved in cell wall biosynthesis